MKAQAWMEKREADPRPYMVTVSGTIYVDTTVAVIAYSGAEAAKKALDGVHCDTTEWLHYECLCEDPVVTDVSEETLDELESADQKHLLNPQHDLLPRPS